MTCMMMPTNCVRESSFSSGLRFCRSKTSYIMGGFCLLYLPMILLMRSGDVETNPGPNIPMSLNVFSGLRFCRSKTSYIMGGFCLLYLPMILLMRSGDVETNPGPNTEGSVSEWELLQLAKRINPDDYLTIGLSLEVPHAQLQGIMIQELKNTTKALMAVFMTWNHRQLPSVNKRAVLADKLRQCGLVSLSNQIRNGNLDSNFTEENHQIFAAAATADLSLSSTGEKDFDDVLKDIAKETRTDERVDDLGKALGISIANIGGYKVANKGGIKYDGTLEMLRDWRKTQSSSTMRKTLRDALVKVGRTDLQEKHFPAHKRR